VNHEIGNGGTGSWLSDDTDWREYRAVEKNRPEGRKYAGAMLGGETIPRERVCITRVRRSLPGQTKGHITLVLETICFGKKGVLGKKGI